MAARRNTRNHFGRLVNANRLHPSYGFINGLNYCNHCARRRGGVTVKAHLNCNSDNSASNAALKRNSLKKSDHLSRKSYSPRPFRAHFRPRCKSYDEKHLKSESAGATAYLSAPRKGALLPTAYTALGAAVKSLYRKEVYIILKAAFNF